MDSVIKYLRRKCRGAGPGIFLVSGGYALLLGLAATPTLANADAPLLLRAEHVTVNQRSGHMRYRVRAHISKGRLSLTADDASAIRRNNEIHLIRAHGRPARARRQAAAGEAEILIEARTLVYDVQARTLTATGNVYAQRGQDRIQGEHIVYSLVDGSLKAVGSDHKPIIMLITPRTVTEDAP